MPRRKWVKLFLQISLYATIRRIYYKSATFPTEVEWMFKDCLLGRYSARFELIPWIAYINWNYKPTIGFDVRGGCSIS